ncbi:signal peptidase I [Botrimarina sp.]|uniref:signal peptidase I n=1 Tax=Botrimarina sp. TaxID=2795802 RepID=UPI0032EF8828
MAKKNKNRPVPPTEPDRVPTPAEAKTAEASPAQRSRRGGRETVDALVVAFVLAFLIRTFVAEMFVIPTGSMAPTLMGRHKDVFCVQCGTRFRINSSDDTESALPQLQQEVQIGRITPRQAQLHLDGLRCIGGQCPQCRYVMVVDDTGMGELPPSREGEGEQEADYSGDRLLVSKYAYSFGDPQRWDVAVFKYPGDSETNYIKRVVGLPGEELRVFDGDLWTRPLDAPDAEFQIARKPADVLLAMSQLVHDTHHEPKELIDAGWPLPWRGDAWRAELGDPVGSHGATVYRPVFRIDASSEATEWLRYYHTPPGEPVWQAVTEDAAPDLARFAQPQLVTDHTPYNTQLKLAQAARLQRVSLEPIDERDIGRIGPHWVGDLILEAEFEIESGDGRVSFDLVEAGDHFGATLDVASGGVELWRSAFESDDRQTLAEAVGGVRGSGRHTVRLANVDNQLRLWLDGALILEAEYQRSASGPATAPRTSESDPGDLAPAGVGASGVAVRVDRLTVSRDGYYIATRWDEPAPLTTDIPTDAFADQGRRDYGPALLALPEEPDLWPALAERRRVDFDVRDGQLFVMGDNSGFSLDARLWAGGNGPGGGGRPGGPYLESKQLVGKAIWVYWPHAWYSLPFTNRMIPVWPNFEDMRLVR